MQQRDSLLVLASSVISSARRSALARRSRAYQPQAERKCASFLGEKAPMVPGYTPVSKIASLRQLRSASRHTLVYHVTG